MYIRLHYHYMSGTLAKNHKSFTYITSIPYLIFCILIFWSPPSHAFLFLSPQQIGYTFLPCVLAGLSRAPQYLVKDSHYSEKGCLFASDVDSVLLPVDACGGDGALAFARSKQNKVEIRSMALVIIFFPCIEFLVNLWFHVKGQSV